MKDLQPGSQPFRMPLPAIDWEALARDSGYRLDLMVANSRYSLRTLQRYVSDRFNVSLREFITRMRLNRASELLLAGRPVKEVAVEVGYKQTSHFVRCYRETFGITPGAQRSQALHSSPLLGGNAETPRFEF